MTDPRLITDEELAALRKSAAVLGQAGRRPAPACFVLAALRRPEYRDAVLDALGLEQVGWVNYPAPAGDLYEDDEGGFIPVYRLGGSHE